MQYIVGVAEKKASDQAADTIATYSLGSCIGLTLYDPVARVGGMVHCMLPSSTLDPEKARKKPEMFTDTGTVALLEEVIALGAEKSRLVAKVAGAAKLLDSQGVFNIGEKNGAVLRKLLEKNGIPIAAEDVGGMVARTMFLSISTGTTVLRISGKEKVL